MTRPSRPHDPHTPPLPMTVIPRRRCRRRGIVRPLLVSLMLSFFLLLLLLLPNQSRAIESSFTPAEKDSDQQGPLPLSQSQRNQLLQLEQAIMSSPDPEATLRQVAEQNSMPPEELAGMLDRNRRDMEHAGGAAAYQGGGGIRNTLPRRILSLVWGLIGFVLRGATAHPRNFSVVLTTLLLTCYVIYSAPRNGIVISTSPRAFLSNGHTTLLEPPASYISAYMASDDFKSLGSSLPKTGKKKKSGKSGLSRYLGDAVWDMDQDDVTVEELGRNSNLLFSITARMSIPVDSLVSNDWINTNLEQAKKSEVVDSDSDAVGRYEDVAQYRDAVDLAYTAALSVLSERRFSEFLSDEQEMLRFHSSNIGGAKEGAAIIMKSLGDLKRYGIQSLRVSYEEEGSLGTSVAFFTLAGGHFDGEIRFSVEKKGGVNNEQDEEGVNLEDIATDEGVIVSVSLVVPKDGRKPNKKLAEKLVVLFAESIVKSATTRAKQTLARQSQSSVYRGRAVGRATERRHIRFENEKKMEEMAEDRRRRWQRANRDAGRYRPSGHRMRSPNNC